MLVQVPSANSPCLGDDFDHLKGYYTACTLDDEARCARKYEELKIGSLHEVIMEVYKGCLKQVTKVHIEYALNEA